jgi:uncharacterized membrane protein YuzA (DUF378 family)
VERGTLSTIKEEVIMKRTTLDWICFVLVVIGGINWGLVGLLNINLVQGIFGFIPGIARIIYILIGIAAGYMIYVAIRQSRPTPPSI